MGRGEEPELLDPAPGRPHDAGLHGRLLQMAHGASGARSVRGCLADPEEAEPDDWLMRSADYSSGAPRTRGVRRSTVQSRDDAMKHYKAVFFDVGGTLLDLV